ncbi:hypothetical protein V8D89_016229 [Ganoderma adspersum]
MPTRGSVLVKRVPVTLPTRGSVLVKRVPDKPPSHQDDNNGHTTYHMSMSSVWHTIHIKSKKCVASTFVSVFFLTLGLQSIFYSTQFLDATYHPNSDLDLYILPNDTLLVLGAYLLRQGYIYVPKEWQQEDFLEDTPHVLDTLDVIPDIEDKDRPNYRSKSIRTVILAFHSTCVMNIITYNAAFSLYPYAMFNHRESLTLDMKMHLAKLDTTGVAIPSSPSLLVSNLAWDPITERGWTLGTHFSHSAEIIVQTPGINLYLSSSLYTPSNFHHILPFLLPPGTLEMMMLDISSSQETVAKTIACCSGPQVAHNGLVKAHEVITLQGNEVCYSPSQSS